MGRIVYIEYCNGWGYYSRFANVKQAIQAAYPGVSVVGNSNGYPRPSAFEVTTGDGRKIFSKLETGSFPSGSQVVDRLRSAGF